MLLAQNVLSDKTRGYRHIPDCTASKLTPMRLEVFQITHALYMRRKTEWEKDIDIYNFDSLNEAVNASEKNSSSGRPRRLI